VQTVTVPGFSDYRIKGSKFYGLLLPVTGTDEIDEKLGKVRSEHPSATHHCYAWRINPDRVKEFSQDDGEPSGSAGLPILNALRSYQLINCLLVSVRYYGGTKLGKKGLIEAYGATAKMCINNAGLKKIVPVITYRIVYPYPLQSAIDKMKNDFRVIEFSASYLENAELILGIPVEDHSGFRKVLLSIEHKIIKVEELGRSFSIL
jgi:uncharacterized YigZ family protein